MNCVKTFSFFVQGLGEKFKADRFYTFVDSVLDVFRLLYQSVQS